MCCPGRAVGPGRTPPGGRATPGGRRPRCGRRGRGRSRPRMTAPMVPESGVTSSSTSVSVSVMVRLLGGRWCGWRIERIERIERIGGGRAGESADGWPGPWTPTPISASSPDRSATNRGSPGERGSPTSTGRSSETVPSAQDEHPVGQQDGLVDVVGDQQHGRVVPGAQLPDQVVHADAGQGVEGAEGLVQQQQLRLAHQRPGQGHPLGLAPREGLGPVPLVPARGRPRPGPRARGPGPRRPFGRGPRCRARGPRAAGAGPGTRRPGARARRPRPRPRHRVRPGCAGGCSCPSRCGRAGRRTRRDGCRGRCPAAPPGRRRTCAGGGRPPPGALRRRTGRCRPPTVDHVGHRPGCQRSTFRSARRTSPSLSRPSRA